jgi:hypothetical protein
LEEPRPLYRRAEGVWKDMSAAIDKAKPAMPAEAEAGQPEGVSATAPAEEANTYKPLRENQIRLLEILPGALDGPIRCQFRVVSLDAKEPVPHAALSHTWGSNFTDQKILVDGKSILVTSNLADALLVEGNHQSYSHLTTSKGWTL